MVAGGGVGVGNCFLIEEGPWRSSISDELCGKLGGAPGGETFCFVDFFLPLFGDGGGGSTFRASGVTTGVTGVGGGGG